MTITFIRNYRAGECLPDYETDNYYSPEELHKAVFVSSDDVTGAETYRLVDGRLATLYSIDLDYDNNLSYEGQSIIDASDCITLNQGDNQCQ